MSDDFADARARLRELAEQLRKLKFPTSPISADLTAYAANAIEDFLTRKVPSLDVAFGVKAGPKAKKIGRPPNHTPERETAILAGVRMRLEGKTWEEICDSPELAEHLGAKNRDASTIRKMIEPRMLDLAPMPLGPIIIQDLKQGTDTEVLPERRGRKKRN